MRIELYDDGTANVDGKAFSYTSTRRNDRLRQIIELSPTGGAAPSHPGDDPLESLADERATIEAVGTVERPKLTETVDDGDE